ncbi:hypothetical protein GQ457_01G028350 [Hibiscus cannabinus]
MAPRKVPTLSLANDGNDAQQPELDQLDLNEDDNINEENKNHSLVGKIISNRIMKHLTIFAILKKAWQCGDDLECHDLDQNMFLFVLPSIIDKQRVLSQKPWAVQDKLIVLKEWPTEATLEEIDFSFEEFWVQVHNIPMSLISYENTVKIGSLFHVVHHSNISESSMVQRDGQLSIRLGIHVDDPLKIGFCLNRKSLPATNVTFKYGWSTDFEPLSKVVPLSLHLTNCLKYGCKMTRPFSDIKKGACLQPELSLGFGFKLVIIVFVSGRRAVDPMAVTAPSEVPATACLTHLPPPPVLLLLS